MGERKSLEKASAREKKWVKIFNALVELSHNLQNDRQILEARVKGLQESIHKTKLEQKVDSLKAILILGLKERESAVYKHRYENAECDLADFRDWCDYLVQKCSGATDTSIDVSNRGENSQNMALRDEVRRLKSEFEKYKMDKSSEISVLLSEKSFVWNQYNQMENSFQEQLREKCHEADVANEKVQILVTRADELTATNEQLQASITKMESETIRKNEEISQLRKEIEVLKSRSGSASTSLRPCRADIASSSRGGKNRRTTSSSRSIAKVKEESTPTQTTKTGNSRSKRKATDVMIIPDTPRLFSSSFKVPKLKNSSSLKIV